MPKLNHYETPDPGVCGRPNQVHDPQRIFHLSDGRWWDAEIAGWRDCQRRRLRQRLRDEDLLTRIRFTRVVPATPHRDHDTANNEDANLAALCQRCHAATSCTTAARISATAGSPYSGKAMSALFQGSYPAA
ncbi:hypothetical protein [Methylobacterium variabile]|jgi:hypothetical protein|uniref:hypothetical protein n=1 Tax=Methylobacterium variabile TaxID=298794 RepID=UPI0012EDE51F|nr:hypothetical protein [Methylobacterium variabile]